MTADHYDVYFLMFALLYIIGLFDIHFPMELHALRVRKPGIERRWQPDLNINGAFSFLYLAFTMTYIFFICKSGIAKKRVLNFNVNH